METRSEAKGRFHIEKLEERIAPTTCCCCCQPSHAKGNNGVGNGLDPQPPGNPPINDGPGTSPGHPGNQHGH